MYVSCPPTPTGGLSAGQNTLPAKLAIFTETSKYFVGIYSSFKNFKVWKTFKYTAFILTIRDNKKHPKLHKYTLRLYIYAVLRGLHCTPMAAFSHGFLQWFVWKPNIQYFSSSYWMSYTLPLRILHSLRKPSAFLTRIHFILYWNVLHSHKECSCFSYRA